MSTDAVTKDLIFGCGRIKGGSEEKHYRALLDKAFELGIRRFDVAPSYGLGMAEDVLGAAIASSGLKDEISVITKYGIPRPVSPGLLIKIRAMAKAVALVIPGARQAMLSQLSKVTSQRGYILTADGLYRSLDESIRRLRTDKFESLLLHEVSSDRLNDSIISALERLKQDRVFSSYGVSTGGDWESLVPIGNVRQCSVRGISRAPLENGVKYNVHGIFKVYLDEVRGMQDSYARFVKDAESELEVADWGGCFSLYLASMHPQVSGVIFSTNSLDRLRESVSGFSLLKQNFNAHIEEFTNNMFISIR